MSINFHHYITWDYSCNQFIYIHVYIYEVSSISFQTFFVQAFKIVVDS